MAKKPCPYCTTKEDPGFGKTFTSRGTYLHIARMHKDKKEEFWQKNPPVVLREYISEPKVVGAPNGSSLDAEFEALEKTPIVERIENDVGERYKIRKELKEIKQEVLELKEDRELGRLSNEKYVERRADIRKRLLPLRARSDAIAEPYEPVLKETPSPNVEKTRKLREEKHQSSKVEDTTGITVQKVKNWAARRQERKTQKEQARLEAPKKEMKDPEGALDVLTKIPALVVMGLVMYKAFTDFAFFTKWIDTDIAQLYFYVLAHPSDMGSILILVLTGLIVAMAVFLVHKLAWRFFFKDLQIRGLSKSVGDTKFQGTSFEGRIYLTIGYGTLDRLYRRFTKTEKPEVVTIYFRTGLRSPTLLNPFKVLASCHKGYVRQPIGTRRIVTDGLFKRTLIATHKRRDTEYNSTVYWFELERYDQKLFDSLWYESTHKRVIKSGLDKVSKACLMDSTVQKHQMENVIAWVPEVEINEHKAIHALKQEKMPLQVEQ